MDVIRSNYSTLSKIAQAEAPTAPEYPFTDMFNSYRQTLSRLEDTLKPENRPGSRTAGSEGLEDIGIDEMAALGPSASSSTSPQQQQQQHQSNHTMSFQRILKHFFDDYFQRDADDETSADMAQRWVAFARTGDPNYEDSKVEWVPWRYIPGDQSMDSDHSPSGPADIFDLDDRFWMDNGDNEDSGDPWDDEGRLGRVLRQRALQALNMEVIEDDELRTELRRTKATKPDPDNPFFSLKFLSHFGVTSTKESEAVGSAGNLPRDVVRQAQRAAQEMGVLGTGLTDRGSGIFQSPQQIWDDDFFPQLLELMWPPEGRLVERDCTCDLWDRIRCKFTNTMLGSFIAEYYFGLKHLHDVLSCFPTLFGI